MPYFSVQCTCLQITDDHFSRAIKLAAFQCFTSATIEQVLLIWASVEQQNDAVKVLFAQSNHKKSADVYKALMHCLPSLSFSSSSIAQKGANFFMNVQVVIKSCFCYTATSREKIGAIFTCRLASRAPLTDPSLLTLTLFLKFNFADDFALLFFTLATGSLFFHLPFSFTDDRLAAANA